MIKTVMANCLRRVVKNYCTFSYQSSRNQISLIDQRSVSSSPTTATELDRTYSVHKLRRTNSSRPRTDSLRRSTTDNCEEKHILNCAKECEAYKVNVEHKDFTGSALPDIEQLNRIQNILCEDLPKLFEKPLDLSIYHKNLVFENHLMNGRSTKGIKSYLNQINLLKMYASVKYSSVKFEILKITTHRENGTVKVRWRIIGVLGYKVLAQYLKQKVLKQKENNENEEYKSGWFDGFSIFYVMDDGLVHRHTVTKLMPNDASSVRSINPFATNLAMFLGLVSRNTAPTLFQVEDYRKFIELDTPSDRQDYQPSPE